MIELRKPVRRRLTLPRTGRVTVELSPEGIRYREFGRRRWLLIPHTTAYLSAAKLAAAQIVALRKQERLARRKLRELSQ